MKYLFSLIAIVTMTLGASASNKTADDNFMIMGQVYELDIFSEKESEASQVQIVIYQDQDIYVAFFTGKKGDYEFELPIGHEYEIWFGGSAFVNKRIYVDARPLQARAGGYELTLDMKLFRPMDSAEFPILNEPYVRIGWDAAYAQFVPDLKYTEDRNKELEKQLKKLRKEKRS